MGPEFWSNPFTGIKKCSEFSLGNACPEPIFGDCCKIVACSYCLKFTPYGATEREGEAEFATTKYLGVISGVTFELFVRRDEYSNECEAVAKLDGEEIYIKTCYDGMSCRDLSGSAEVTVGYDTGLLEWIKLEPAKLPHRTDERGCKTWFCDNCDCSCDVLCVTIFENGITMHTGELHNVNYECEIPAWRGTVGGFVLSFDLSRDSYDRCILLPAVNEVSQSPILAPGCAGMSATLQLNETTRIELTCRGCTCDTRRCTDCCDGRHPITDMILTIVPRKDCCSSLAGSHVFTYQGIVENYLGECTVSWKGFLGSCPVTITCGAGNTILVDSCLNPNPTWDMSSEQFISCEPWLVKWVDCFDLALSGLCTPTCIDISEPCIDIYWHEP